MRCWRFGLLVAGLLLFRCGPGGPPREGIREPAGPGVPWAEWGEEPFRRARQEDRPVLLQVTAAWCHPCRLMERETFSDPEVVRLAREFFVPVRVDRDRFPEVYRRYREAARVLKGRDGWPLTLFLTPDGDVIRAEWFLHPRDRRGQPGLRHLLQAVADRYGNQAEAVRNSAESLTERVEQQVRRWVPGALDGGVLRRIAEGFRRGLDPVYGGFGPPPKYPPVPALRFAIHWGNRTQDPGLTSWITGTLSAMARGGIHDQLGGGFHRSAVDAAWILPSFEKMSYTNAGLLEVYLLGYQMTGEDSYREVAEGIADYVLEWLTDGSRGGFYASQAADFAAADGGGFYTWTQEEIREATSARQAKLLLIFYDVGIRGESPGSPDRNVLFVAETPERIAATLGMEEPVVRDLIRTGREALREARGRRDPPAVDRSLYAGWNGQMIRAFLEAYRVLEREDCRQAAIAALDRILAENPSASGAVCHRIAGEEKVPGDLEDHVWVARALLSAYEVTGRDLYLERARKTLEFTLASFRDPSSDGLLDRPAQAGGPGLLRIRTLPVVDSPSLPSANAVAAIALDRLSYLTKERAYHERAGEILRAFAGRIPGYGFLAAAYGLALEHHLQHPLRVVVLGSRSDSRTSELTRAAYRAFHPGKMVLTLDPDRDAGRVRAIGYPPGDRPLAYVCTDRACAPPVSDPSRMAATIREFARRALAAPGP